MEMWEIDKRKFIEIGSDLFEAATDGQMIMKLSIEIQELQIKYKAMLRNELKRRKVQHTITNTIKELENKLFNDDLKKRL